MKQYEIQCKYSTLASDKNIKILEQTSSFHIYEY